MIKNLTRGTVVSKDLKIANNLTDTFFGMLLRKNSGGLVFNTRFGIHTLFMSRPIDILVLNSKGNVVGMKKSLKPNRVYVWNPKFCKVLELPQGIIDKSQTEIGDRLTYSS